MQFEEIKPITPENDEEKQNDEKVQIPEWDLVPPFDTIDRGDM